MSTTVARGQRGADEGVSKMRQSIEREYGFEEMRVEGKLPQDLVGTLYRNGPGLYELFDRPYAHMFEGDGAVSAVRLSGGKAMGAVRVVESAGLLEERRQGKVLYGFNAPWWRRFVGGARRDVKNTANTHVVPWQGRLFALMEASKPTELSMEDLSTIGETDLGGVVAESFSAHPHEVPGRKAMYNFGMRYGRESSIDLFELPASGPARRLGGVPLPYPVMLHDCMVTEKHFVFFVSPVKISIWRALLAVGPFHKLFQWAPQEGTEILVVPIDRPEEVVRFRTDAFYQWHFANGYEKDGEIVIDFVGYPDFASLDALKSKVKKQAMPETMSSFVRAVIDPKARTFRKHTLWPSGCEFPRIHPAMQGRDYRYTWMVGMSEIAMRERPEHGANQIICLDVKEEKTRHFQLPDGQVTSEPVFVPRPNSNDEADGYVLSYIYEPHSQKSFMGIWDTLRLEDGPVAKVWFEHHIPTTFHGSWVPA